MHPGFLEDLQTRSYGSPWVLDLRVHLAPFRVRENNKGQPSEVEIG